MSSLVVSILILAVSALVAVAAVNVAQAIARRRRQAVARPRKSGAGRSRKATGDDGADPEGDAAEPATRPAARVGERREPRLGEVDLSALDEEMPEAVESAGGREAGHPEHPAPGAPGRVASPAPGATAAAVPPDSTATVPGPAPDRNPASRPGAQPPARPTAAPVLSPLCDCIVVLPFDRPVPGERLIAATQGVRRAGGKPILFDAVPFGAASDDQAAPLAAGVACRALRVGVLLANRHGPLNAMEYSEFVTAVQSIADQLSTLADTPDMADVIARARDLDATCAQLDAQIGLNVDSPEPLGPPQVAALAAEFGLVDRGGHRHARLGPAGELVFTMSLTDSPQRLGFLLDVPRTGESLEAWSAMIDCAQDVAARLSGKVVDDAGRQIPLESLDTIARQLTQRYASLDAIGVPAGSPLALRVFN